MRAVFAFGEPTAATLARAASALAAAGATRPPPFGDARTPGPVPPAPGECTPVPTDGSKAGEYDGDGIR